MKTIVITGGTDGIGRGLARTYLDRGDTVVIVGRNAAKADERAVFIRADLSLVGETRKAVEELQARFPVIDALILCARHFRSRRYETAEGIEENFALFYLSRYLLSHSLAAQLEASERPVIMNVAGPGADLSLVRWNDLEFSEDYNGVSAMFQGGKLNDLLGESYAGSHPSISYVLFHPGMTATGLSGDYDAADAAHMLSMKRFGKSVGQSIAPIVPLIDTPPTEALTAFVEGRRITLPDDKAAAARLDDLTRKYLPPTTRNH
ncbi:SDR family NAD(P)-dependent oxidoreductase [Actinomadura rudentiformis]|uniref:SDR family NAD(P)-dependent oxidoreductase n=1 Tax=Actinomadura rudentiformis TaxID=359158 RepID=A0A6H9YK67_9ACTN|nr:SDR family NAD(P)-dependent oxidoreductase [Actinomadura rudentiformis]KAB2347415.1 SDR family NAD(P)-dependent oxidoreductase [Actinomadura rudentiformis]